MDILRFINSRDIREYLKSRNDPFTSLEAAWLMDQFRCATIKEKHAAWQELIRIMPDCAVAGNIRRLYIFFSYQNCALLLKNQKKCRSEKSLLGPDGGAEENHEWQLKNMRKTSREFYFSERRIPVEKMKRVLLDRAILR